MSNTNTTALTRACNLTVGDVIAARNANARVLGVEPGPSIGTRRMVRVSLSDGHRALVCAADAFCQRIVTR